MPQASAAGSRDAEESRFRKWFNRVLAVGAFTTAINVGLAWFAYQQVRVAEENVQVSQRQLQVTKDALDRSTGKVTAKFEFADFQPDPGAFRDDQKTVVFGLKDHPLPYYKDANSLVVLPPTLFLNNTGTEPIDAVRVEVSFLDGIIDRRLDGLDPTKPPALPPPDWYKVDTPVGVRKVEREEHALAQQWKPGQSLRLSILRSILGQLHEFQSRSVTDRVHIAHFEINVSARLTGSPAYDSDGTNLVYMVAWLPKGFPEDEYKRVFDNYQAKLEFGPSVPARIPTMKGSRDENLPFLRAPNYSNPNTYKPKE